MQPVRMAAQDAAITAKTDTRASRTEATPKIKLVQFCAQRG